MVSAQAMYTGRKDAKGNVAFPGFSPGAEAQNGAWNAWLTGQTDDARSHAMGYAFTSDALKYFAYQDPNFDFLKMDMLTQYPAAQKKMAAAKPTGPTTPPGAPVPPGMTAAPGAPGAATRRGSAPRSTWTGPICRAWCMASTASWATTPALTRRALAMCCCIICWVR